MNQNASRAQQILFKFSRPSAVIVCAGLNNKHGFGAARDAAGGGRRARWAGHQGAVGPLQTTPTEHISPVSI